MVQWYVTKPLFSGPSSGSSSASASNVPSPPEKFFPTGRLDTPFYCHDVTDRALRVPYADPAISTHPCGARGILSVEVLVPEASIDSYVMLYSAVTGAAANVHGGYRYSPTTSVNFSLSVPNTEDSVMAELASKGRVGIEIRAPRDGEDESWLQERGVGIREVRIFVPAQGADEVDERQLDTEGTGASLVLVSEPTGC